MSEIKLSDLNVIKHRLKLMALWFFIGAGFVAVAVLNLMEPGIVEKYINGEIWADYKPGPGLIFMALLYFIPLSMAVLSIMLNQSINRLLNKIMSILFLLLLLGSIIEHLSEHVAGSDLIVYGYSLGLMALELAASVLLVFYSFRKTL